MGIIGTLMARLEAAGIPLRPLAIRAGLNPNTLYSWKAQEGKASHRGEPEPENVAKVADALAEVLKEGRAVERGLRQAAKASPRRGTSKEEGQ